MRSSRQVFAASLLGIVIGGAGIAPAAAAAITLEPVVSGLSSPVLVTHAGDGSGRLFLLEQTGTIKVLQPGSGSPTTFLDISDRVLFGGERGLLGLAFHPQFETNHRFFVNYTRRGDGATVIAEYHLSATDPNVADRAETVLLTIAQPFANHNGGMIEFGPDGNLYIGAGDGGSANDPGQRAQSILTLLGKILRIDVDHPASATQLYSSPATNPFAGPANGLDEIYAVGLRNPWRFSFDRLNGDLMVGDVGQGAREEIDRVVNGGNYGWRTFEGTLCTGLDAPPCDPTGFIFPITEYAHSGGRCSVTGGYVYRGSRGSLPFGAYVYGDYCSGEMFLLESGQVSLLAAPPINISSFGQDQDGELYVLDLGGAVYRIVSASPCDFISIAPSGLSFAETGGSGAVNVTAGEECAWAASTGQDWITITEGISGAGNGTVHYDVAPNPGPSARFGALSIAGRVHTVSQSAPRRCTVTVNTTRILATRGGGIGMIAVAARNDCHWAATSTEPWFVFTSAATGTGNGLLRYRIDPNLTGRTRFTLLKIGGRLALVRQQ